MCASFSLCTKASAEVQGAGLSCRALPQGYQGRGLERCKTTTNHHSPHISSDGTRHIAAEDSMVDSTVLLSYLWFHFS